MEEIQRVKTIFLKGKNKRIGIELNQSSEKGFFYLSVFLKTIRDGVTFYLLAISVLSFFLLYKFDKKYCIFPLIALCIYLARFGVGRNFMQIRAGLAIPIVLLSIK